MTDIIRYVVDASVAIKWHLLDGDDAVAADELLTDFRQGRVDLIAPQHIRYEIANAIRTAVRRGRIEVRQGRPTIEEFLGWQIPTVDGDELLLAGYDMALRYDCALYDGLYLALAASAACPFIYADHRLRNSLDGRFPLAVWLTDYDPAATRA